MSDANPIDEGKEVAMKVEGGEEIMRGIRGQGEGVKSPFTHYAPGGFEHPTS